MNLRFLSLKGVGDFSPRPRGRGKGVGLLALSFPPSNNPALSDHNPRLLEENRPLISQGSLFTPQNNMIH